MAFLNASWKSELALHNGSEARNGSDTQMRHREMCVYICLYLYIYVCVCVCVYVELKGVPQECIPHSASI